MAHCFDRTYCPGGRALGGKQRVDTLSVGLARTEYHRATRAVLAVVVLAPLVQQLQQLQIFIATEVVEDLVFRHYKINSFQPKFITF